MLEIEENIYVSDQHANIFNNGNGKYCFLVKSIQE